MSLVGLPLVLVILLCFTQSDCKIRIRRLRVKHPTEIGSRLCTINVTYWNDPSGTTYFNTSAECFEDLGKQKLTMTIYQPLTPSDYECTHVYMKTSVDFCKAANGLFSNSFIRTFMLGFLDKADHVPGCNTPKGISRATNFKLDDKLLFPVQGEWRFRLILEFYATKLNARKFLPLYSIEVVAIYELTVNLGTST